MIYILRRCCNKYHCSTKVLQKNLCCYILTYLHTYLAKKGAAKESMYHQRCCKKYRTAHCKMQPAAWFFMYHQRCCKRYLVEWCHILTYLHTFCRCSMSTNVLPKVLQKVPTSVNSTGAAKVPVHYISTIAAPPTWKPGSPEERKERMEQVLLERPGAFIGTSWILVRRPSRDLHVFSVCIIPKPELRGFWGSSLIKPPFRVASADVVIN